MPFKSKHNISMFLKKKKKANRKKGGTMLGENAAEPLQLCHTFLSVIFSFPFLLFILGIALLPMQLPFNSCRAPSYIFQAFGSFLCNIFFPSKEAQAVLYSFRNSCFSWQWLSSWFSKGI